MNKKFIAITTLLLVAGCSANYAPNTAPNNAPINQQSPNPTKVQTHGTHARNVAPTNLTQASSITLPGAGMTIKQTPDYASNWLDWLNGRYGAAPAPAPGGNPGFPGSGTPQYGTPQGGTPQYGTPQGGTNQQPADSSQFAQQVLTIVNQERSKAGLKPLTMNANLSKVAMAKAQDMYNNNYFDHQSPTYGSPFDMMRQFGITYNYAGENIAKGQRTPTEVMNQWMNSPGHRANILQANFTQIGVAFYNNEWVQEFTG